MYNHVDARENSINGACMIKLILHFSDNRREEVRHDDTRPYKSSVGAAPLTLPPPLSGTHAASIAWGTHAHTMYTVVPYSRGAPRPTPANCGLNSPGAPSFFLYSSRSGRGAR